jgi:hypothetical protein
MAIACLRGLPAAISVLMLELTALSDDPDIKGID